MRNIPPGAWMLGRWGLLHHPGDITYAHPGHQHVTTWAACGGPVETFSCNVRLRWWMRFCRKCRTLEKEQHP